MNKTTQTTFKGLGGCHLFVYEHPCSDGDSSLKVTDTTSGDSVELDGLTAQSLRSGIRNYVSMLGSRDESTERRKFVEDLSEDLQHTLKRWEESKAKEAA